MPLDPDRQLAGAGALTANEQFFDAMIRHQIGVLRVSGSISNEVKSLLDATEADVRRQIVELSRRGVGLQRPAQVRRLERLDRILADIRRNAWRQVSETWSSSLRELAVEEPAFIDRILKSTMIVNLETALPAASRLRAIVTSRPFEGRTLSQWAQKIARDDIERIQGAIRIGLVQGETGQQIARRVVGTVRARGANGVIEISRRHAETLTRTATNSVANSARREYFEENRNLFSTELFVATLDHRTTLICSSLDGERFPIGEGPIPPLHMRCRSLRSPVVDQEVAGERPAREFTERGLLREFARRQNISPVTSRSNLPRGTKGEYDRFARRRKRELTGTVPAKTSYQEFLKRQSREFQNDYLGDTKAKLFRQGVPLTRFVDPTGNPLTLSELARTEARFFRAAGLDPANF